MNYYDIFLKRIFDLIFSLFLFIIFSPFLLLSVLLLLVFNRGQIFYKHERVGRNGKKFILYKFRTMQKESSKILKKYLNENYRAKREWESNQKLIYDPRITKLGWFLREYSLDELPQLINEVFGNMSLVGPRPIVESEIPKYKEEYNMYKKVRPGLTGYWQISGRNNVSNSKRVILDTYYICNMSFKLDLYILVKTIPVVLSRKGAY